MIEKLYEDFEWVEPGEVLFVTEIGEDDEHIRGKVEGRGWIDLYTLDSNKWIWVEEGNKEHIPLRFETR